MKDAKRSKSGPQTVAVIVLAAGLGKRMQSKLPKVLHPVGGIPMVIHVLRAISKAASQDSSSFSQAKVALVVGHGRELVEAAVKKILPTLPALEVEFVLQSEQLGTGHAARCAMDSPWGVRQIEDKRTVLVLPGDVPLIRAELFQELAAPLDSSPIRVVTQVLENATGYGRIVRRGKSGPIQKIVEEKDASPREKKITEVNTSIYAFNPTFLKSGLERLKTSNAQKEYYLTDLVSQGVRAKKKVDVLLWNESEDLRGVNDLFELSQISEIQNARVSRAWARAGVRIVDLKSTWIESTVILEAGVILHPGVHLRGETQIGAGSEIGPNVLIENSNVGRDSVVKMGTVITDSKVDSQVSLGPYAHLRPESSVGQGSKIGNFVELKKTTVGSKTNISHLSYLGDAVVGSGVNIGCGFITCNFDGRVVDGNRKHTTTIEDGVFMGSDCQTVAPVRVGRGAYVASGSTITENVEAESLAIARSRQVNKPGYAKRFRKSGE